MRGHRDALSLSRQHPACNIHGKEMANWFVMKDLKFTRQSRGLSRQNIPLHQIISQINLLRTFPLQQIIFKTS